MKLWLDDVRPAPSDYEYHAYSVDAAKMMIESAEELGEPIEVIDCDHDLGDYAEHGGDGIKLLDWLLERNTLYPIKLHTANPVGRANMQRMIDRYWYRDDETNIENNDTLEKDEYGRENNKAQTIRSLDKLRMAHLFNDMQKNPTKYPQDVESWLTWLNQKSGDNIFNL